MTNPETGTTRTMNGGNRMIRGLSVLGAFVLSGVMVLGVAVPVFAAGVDGPGWVPSGVEGSWTVPSYPYPVDVDWGDGQSQDGVGQPISHTYGTPGSYTIEASHFDIDNGTVLDGTLLVSTVRPTFKGPYLPGTTTKLTKVEVGQTVEFLATIPGAHNSLEFSIDGVWVSYPVGTPVYSTSFPAAGFSKVGMRVGGEGWSSTYVTSFVVEVVEPVVTTTTTVPDTTTTTVTATTTSSSTTTVPTATTTLAVSSPGSDTQTTTDPTTTTIPRDTTTTTESDEAAALPPGGSPGDPQLFSSPEAPVGGNALPWLGVAAIVVGIAGTAIFGYRFIRLGGYADDMIVQPEVGDGVHVDDMIVQPDGGSSGGVGTPLVRWLSGGVAIGSLAIAVLGLLAIVNSPEQAAAASTFSDTVFAARTSDQFVREIDSSSLGGESQIVVTRGGSRMPLNEYVGSTSLTKSARTRDLFIPSVSQEFLANDPTYSETIIELTDRVVVDRTVDVELRNDACTGTDLPNAIAQLCFSETGSGVRSSELGSALSDIRRKLAEADSAEELVAGITVGEARTMPDDDLLGLVLNSGTKRVRHTSVLPVTSTLRADSRRNPVALSDLSSSVESPTAIAWPGVVTDVSQPSQLIEWSGTPTSEPTRYFLTGFTFGEEFADDWEFVICDSWWCGPYYLRLEYGVGYGFGLRAPFSVNVQHETTGEDTKRVAIRVAPVNVESDGSPAFQAVGLPTGKYFKGNEFVLEVTAGCGFVAKLPGKTVDKKCPSKEFSESRDIPPVIGGETSKIKEWWVPSSATGLWFDAGVVAGSIDVGVELGVTDGSFSMQVTPTSGTQVDGLTKGRLSFSSRNPRSLTVSRGDGFESGFALSKPAYTFSLGLKPAVRAQVGVDISIYENEWTLGPWTIPVGISAFTLGLGHHEGTTSQYNYPLFGSLVTSNPTVPAASNSGG